MFLREGVPDLHVELHRFIERDIVQQVIAVVVGVSPFLVPFATRLRDERRGETLRAAIRIPEIVFGAGAENGREGFAIDIDFIVPFTPPCLIVLQGACVEDCDGRAYIPPGTLDGNKIEVASGFGIEVAKLEPSSMKVKAALVPLIVVEGHFMAFDRHVLRSEVGQGDRGLLLEGHLVIGANLAGFQDPS